MQNGFAAQKRFFLLHFFLRYAKLFLPHKNEIPSHQKAKFAFRQKRGLLFFAFSDKCGKPFLCGNKAGAGRFSVCAASAAHTFLFWRNKMNLIKQSYQEPAPKSILDCVKMDPLSQNLWNWASRLETLGKIFFGGIVLFGTVETIILLSNASSNETLSLFFSQFIKYFLFAFCEFCLFRVFALLVGSLASITQNTKATARLSELIVRNQFQEKKEEAGETGNDFLVRCPNPGCAEMLSFPEGTTKARCPYCGQDFDIE